MKRLFNGLSLVFDAVRPHDANMRSVAFPVPIGTASATPSPNVVVGKGDPNLDVPSVQAAVDRGGQVQLHGHFSFDQPATKSTSPQGFFSQMATVLVSNEVVISGTRSRGGEMTSIDGGAWPFAVEAPGSHGTIQRLRFVRPKAGAIQVTAVSGLEVADCRIEGIEPLSDPLLGSVGIPGRPRPSWYRHSPQLQSEARVPMSRDAAGRSACATSCNWRLSLSERYWPRRIMRE